MQVQIQNSHYFPNIGGVQNIMARLAAELRTRRHGVEVLCQAVPGEPVHGEWDGVPVIRHPYDPPAGRAWVLEPMLAPRALRRHIPAYANGTEVFWSLDEPYAIGSAGAVPGVPVVYIAMHNQRRMLLHTRAVSSWRGRLARRLQAVQWHRLQGSALRHADQVVVWCEITKHDMAETFGVPRDRIRVVPLGPGPALPAPAEPPEVLRDRWGVPRGVPVILCVCRLDANKNVPHLVRALAQCRHRSAVLLVVGDGRQRPAIEVLAAELGVRDRVLLVGAHRNPAPFYALADLFAFPSVFEGFGMVLLEAMQWGLPCVALKADFPRVITASEEVIEDGRTGFVVDPYSVPALAQRLDVLCGDPPLRRRMGEAGRERCARHFRWDAHVETLLDLSRALRGGAPSGGADAR